MRQKCDPPVLQLVEDESVQANDHLHVFADGAGTSPHVLLHQAMLKEPGEIAACPHHDLFLEDRKNPAQDEHGLHPIQAGARGSE